MTAKNRLFSIRFSLSNAVGYNSIDVKAKKFIMLGVQFTDVASGDDKISIHSLISGIEGVDYGNGEDFLSTAPQLQVWNGSGYDVYYYLNDAYISDTEMPKGWADVMGNYVEKTFKAGDCAWFMSPNDATITTSGQLFNADSITKDCPTTFVMVANAKPTVLNLNDSAQIKYENLIGVNYGNGEDFLSTAPQIQVWNGSSYDVYYYLNDAYISDTEIPKGWADVMGNYVNTAIAPGAGFWAKGTTGAFTMVFEK